MRVKKAAGKVYGVEFTAAEKKAINLELARQSAEYDRKHARELLALILWELHNNPRFAFGKERLKTFADGLGNGIQALLERYELEDGDAVWLATKQLKEYGVDLEEWEKEYITNA